MLSVLLSVALAIAVLGLVLAWSAFRVRRARPQTGGEALSGTDATAIDAFLPHQRGFEGAVRTHGEIWSAESRTPVDAGQLVIIDGRRGLTLLVHANARARGRTGPTSVALEGS